MAQFSMACRQDACVVEITRRIETRTDCDSDAYDSYDSITEEENLPPSHAAYREWLANPPVLSVRLVQRLCWRACTHGATPLVVRRSDAALAAAICTAYGVAPVWPSVMRHLGRPPEEWLDGPPLEGSTVVTSGGDREIVYGFLPDVPPPPGARLRVVMGERSHAGVVQPAMEWFVDGGGGARRFHTAWF